MRGFVSSLLLLLVGLSQAFALDDAVPVAAEPFRQGVGGQAVTGDLVLSRDISVDHGHGIVIAADGVTLDCAGHTIRGGGSAHGVHVLDHGRVTVENCTIRNFEKGIYLASTEAGGEQLLSSHNSIRRNVLTKNVHGLYLMWSHHATIAENRVLANRDSGIALTGLNTTNGVCSENNVLEHNAIEGNRRGLLTWCPYDHQNGNIVRGNTFVHNVVSATDRFEPADRVSYASNTFDENQTNLFFRYVGDHALAVDTAREFRVELFTSEGRSCENFTVRSVRTSPKEHVSFSKESGAIIGRFVPSRRGLYSLYVEVEGCGQKTMNQRFWFGTEKSKTYYLALGDRNDAGTLVSSPPEESVYVYCTMWIEAGVDEPLDERGIVKITRVRSSMWSNYVDQSPTSAWDNVFALELDHTYSRRADAFVDVSGKYEPGRVRMVEEIDKGPFLYDRSGWLDLAVKYWGKNPDWLSEREEPSRVEISYLVTDDPLIASISNPDVRLLSATSSGRSRPRYRVELLGAGQTSLSLPVNPGREYRVDFDGKRCGTGPKCRVARDEGELELAVELSGREHVIAVKSARRRD